MPTDDLLTPTEEELHALCIEGGIRIQIMPQPSRASFDDTIVEEPLKWQWRVVGGLLFGGGASGHSCPSAEVAWVAAWNSVRTNMDSPEVQDRIAALRNTQAEPPPTLAPGGYYRWLGNPAEGIGGLSSDWTSYVISHAEVVSRGIDALPGREGELS